MVSEYICGLQDQSHNSIQEDSYSTMSSHKTSSKLTIAYFMLVHVYTIVFVTLSESNLYRHTTTFGIPWNTAYTYITTVH